MTSAAFGTGYPIPKAEGIYISFLTKACGGFPIITFHS